MKNRNEDNEELAISQHFLGYFKSILLCYPLHNNVTNI